MRAEESWNLRLTLSGPTNEHYEIAWPLDEQTVRERVAPNKPLADYFPGELSTTQAVEVIRRRELRKDLLEDICQRLGRALGEHLEDKEGWHGEDRKHDRY